MVNFNIMANVIDDQERFRKIQTELFAQFDRALLDPSQAPEDSKVERDVLNYILEQVKRNVSVQLSRIETVCQFRIQFSKTVYAIQALQCMFDTLEGLDDEFNENLMSVTKAYNDEKKKKDE